jgi:hypothetical protein
MIPESSARLARLLISRKRQADAALSLDGYSRWGNNGRYDKKEQHEAMAAQIPETERRIKAGIAALRTTDPDALTHLIDGQIKLLDAIIATSEDSTSVFVAKEEREAWETVRAGRADFVAGNCHYIREDAALFEEIFGFPLYSVAGTELD